MLNLYIVASLISRLSGYTSQEEVRRKGEMNVLALAFALASVSGGVCGPASNIPSQHPGALFLPVY